MPELVTNVTGNDLTYRINGAAMRVHSRLGPGYKEEVHERALTHELEECGIPCAAQVPIEVYDGDARVALFYLDLYVDETVVVEVKAFSHQLTGDEIAQVINYLKATGASVGLLYNFGRRGLDFRRIFPPKNVQERSLPQRLGRDNVKKKAIAE